MKEEHIQNEKHQFPEYIQRALDVMRTNRMDALARWHRVASDSRLRERSVCRLKRFRVKRLGLMKRQRESLQQAIATASQV